MKWFKEIFLLSFENCEGKRVSEKQGEIFKKYLDFEKESMNAYYYTKIINEKIIRLQESSVAYGSGKGRTFYNEYYVTIREA